MANTDTTEHPRDRSQEPVRPIQVLRPAVRRNMNYYPDLGIVYFANAKSGTSTIRTTLWRAVDQKRGTQTMKNNPRDHEKSPALSFAQGTMTGADVDAILDAVYFSVVRHPLVRLVSAYLNKITPNNKDRIWRFLAKRYDLPVDVQVPFGQFVDVLCHDKPNEIERHFRPQWLNLGYGYVPYSHVGQLENLGATARFLEQHGVPSIETFKPHATGAADYLKDYYGDPDVLKQAVALYEKDFEYFNYAPGIDNVLPLGPIAPPEVDTSRLRRIVTNVMKEGAGAADDGDADSDAG